MNRYVYTFVCTAAQALMAMSAEPTTVPIPPVQVRLGQVDVRNVQGLATLPNKKIAIAEESGLCIWDLTKNRKVASAPYPEAVRRSRLFNPWKKRHEQLRISADGKSLLYSPDWSGGYYQYPLPLVATDAPQVFILPTSVKYDLELTGSCGPHSTLYGSANGRLVEWRDSEDRARRGWRPVDMPQVGFKLKDRTAFACNREVAAIVSTDGVIRLWDSVNRKALKPIETSPPASSITGLGATITISANGKTLAVLCKLSNLHYRGKVHVYSLGDDKEVASYEIEADQIVASPDGSLLAACARPHAGQGPRMNLYEAKTGQLKAELSIGGGSIYCFDFLPDGSGLAAVSTEGILYYWDVATGKSLRKHQAHTSKITAIRWLAQGEIATASTDGTVRIWDAAGMPLADFQAHPTPRGVTAMEVASDGKTIFTSGTDSIKVWDNRGKELRRGSVGTNAHGTKLDANLLAMALSPDDKQIAVSIYPIGIRVLDAGTFQKQTEMKVLLFAGPASNSLTFIKPDRLVCRSGSNMSMWDVKEGVALIEVPTLVEGNPYHHRYGISPKAAYIVSMLKQERGKTLLDNQTAGIWKVNDFKLVKTFNLACTFSSLSFLTESVIIAGEIGGRVWLVNTENQESLKIFPAQHTGSAIINEASPDRKRVATAWEKDVTVAVWRVGK